MAGKTLNRISVVALCVGVVACASRGGPGWMGEAADSGPAPATPGEAAPTSVPMQKSTPPAAVPATAAPLGVAATPAPAPVAAPPAKPVVGERAPPSSVQGSGRTLEMGYLLSIPTGKMGSYLSAAHGASAAYLLPVWSPAGEGVLIAGAAVMAAFSPEKKLANVRYYIQSSGASWSGASLAARVSYHHGFASSLAFVVQVDPALQYRMFYLRNDSRSASDDFQSGWSWGAAMTSGILWRAGTWGGHPFSLSVSAGGEGGTALDSQPLSYDGKKVNINGLRIVTLAGLGVAL